MKSVITKYRITGCWYGRKKADTPVKSEDLLSVVSGFCKWVDNAQHMSHTFIRASTYPFKVYVKDCATNNHDFLVALWLSSQEKDANIYAINENDPPNGSQTVEKTKFGKGKIPGFPAYFFIDSDACILYTIRPKHLQVNGRAQFDAALRFYMAQYAGKIEKQKSVQEDETISVALNMIGKDGEALQPKFESTLQKVPSATQELKRRFHEIRKIVHTQDISRKTQDEKASIVRNAFRIIGADLEKFTSRDVSDSRRIKCEVDVRLELEEVEQLIQRQDEVKSNERFGFRFKGDSKTVWADSCIAQKELDIPIEVSGDMPIGAAMLLSALEAKRDKVIK